MAMAGMYRWKQPDARNGQGKFKKKTITSVTTE